MNERDFIYWLRGFLESGDIKKLNENQVKTIKDHLDLVSTKVTPNNYAQQLIAPGPLVRPDRTDFTITC